jgi:hypothetical protein
MLFVVYIAFLAAVTFVSVTLGLIITPFLPKGSRHTKITWLVIFLVGVIAAIIGALYFFGSGEVL